MYLLNNFSTVVDTAIKFSDIVGYTHRYVATIGGHMYMVCTCFKHNMLCAYCFRIGEMMEVLTTGSSRHASNDRGSPGTHHQSINSQRLVMTL